MLELGGIDLGGVGRLAVLRVGLAEPGVERVDAAAPVPTSTSSSRSSSAVVAGRRSAPRRRRTRRPVSRPSSTAITHTRSSSSPASIARSTGAAPRQRGSSEKWRLTIGSSASTCGLISCPKATTTPSSAPTPSTSSTTCDTGMPELGRGALTGLGEVASPRPRRLSAPVTTSATSCPAATSASSGGTAIVRRAEERQSHVSRQTAAAAARRWPCACGRPPLQAAVLGDRFLALLGRHAVEHQHAVEVVELVLEHARLELVGLDLDAVAVEVDAADQHRLRAHHLDVQAGDRQAPFVVDPLAVGLDDLGVEDRPAARPSRSQTKTCFWTPIWGAARAMPRSPRTACRTCRRRGGRACRRRR